MKSLPDGRHVVRIRELITPTKQRDPRKDSNKSFRYVDVSSVSNTLFKIETTTEILGAQAPSRARREIKADDVLFATVRPTLKRIALVPKELDGEIASTGYCILRPRPDKVTPRFLYYSLLTDSFIKAMGALERGASYPAIRDTDIFSASIKLPPLLEQRRIAYVLNTVQTAIEQQARLVALTRELKSALMRKLFTEGLRGEKQKETGIGLVPESWEVLPLGEVIEGTPKNGMYKPLEAYGAGTLILRINDFSNEGDIVISASNRINANEAEISAYSLKTDDIVTNRVNSLSHLGKTALVGVLSEPMLFESNMMRYQVDKTRALPSYIMRLLNSPIGKSQIIASAKRAVAQSSINQGSLKAILLPIPKVDVQKEIVNIVDTVINSIELHSRKKALFEELFRTLLHQLMTGQIRVNGVDLPGFA